VELKLNMATAGNPQSFGRGAWCLLRGCAVSVALLLGTGTAFAQTAAPQPAGPQPESAGPAQPAATLRRVPLPARIREAAHDLQDNPHLKNLTPEQREKAVEFVVGNMLFVVLHELAHTAVADLRLPVLGREEDAADDFAIVTLLKVGSAFTHRVLSEATKGWFFSARRDRKDGEPLAFYDEHSLDQQRAYHIVCLMVGHNPSDADMIDLANEMALPDDRRESCKKDFATSSSSWDLVLKDHQRAAGQPRTKIDIVYGDGEGELAPYAQSFRAVRLLEVVANRYAEEVAWPTPFTLEMKSCGFVNARWLPETRTLTLCYELAADFADLYRAFNKASNKKVADNKAPNNNKAANNKVANGKASSNKASSNKVSNDKAAGAKLERQSKTRAVRPSLYGAFRAEP
jgi:putative metallopeptidase DUF4344